MSVPIVKNIFMIVNTNSKVPYETIREVRTAKGAMNLTLISLDSSNRTLASCWLWSEYAGCKRSGLRRLLFPAHKTCLCLSKEVAGEVAKGWWCFHSMRKATNLLSLKQLCLLKASTARCATPKPVVFQSTATDLLSYMFSVSWKGAWKRRRKQLRRKPRSKNIRSRRRPMTSHSRMHMGPMRKPWTQMYVEYWL